MKGKKESRIYLYVGVLAMLLPIFAISFLPLGSMLQRSLLIAGTIPLLVVAYVHDQKVLTAVELVVLLGGVLSVLGISLSLEISTMALVSVALVAYLYRIGHYKDEPVGLLGTLGFLLLAFGYSMNFGANTLYAAAGLGVGSVLLMSYSLVHYSMYKVKVQLLWAALNAAFAVSPLLFLLSVKPF